MHTETVSPELPIADAPSDPSIHHALRAPAERRANGEGGFGYDPYFLIPEYHLTFGQLSSVVKHRLSHRARAFAKFIPLLRNLRREF